MRARIAGGAPPVFTLARGQAAGTSSWAPGPKLPQTPDELFENGAIFQCPNGQLVYSIYFDEGPGASKWLRSYRAYTRWILVGDAYDTPLYLIPVVGNPFDLRAGKEAAFTIFDLMPCHRIVKMCSICGAHAFTGKIAHLPACPRGHKRERKPTRV